MKRLFVGIMILLAGVVGYGFYEGWFVVSAGDSGHKANVTLTVDRDKVRADEKKLEDVGRGLGKKVTGPTDPAQEQGRQP